MNLAGISVALGLALMAVLALPFSLVLLVPAAWLWYKRQR